MWKSLAVRVRAVTILVVATAILTAVSGNAHEALSRSTPENGAVLDESPQIIELKFSGKPVAVFVKLYDSAGAEVQSLGEPVIDERSVGVPVIGALPKGSYRLTFRIASRDAHSVEGAIEFSVRQASSQTSVP
jgi:methionine-rich copper-binding protein CopC